MWCKSLQLLQRRRLKTPLETPPERQNRGASISDETTVAITVPSFFERENLICAGIPLPPGIFWIKIFRLPGIYLVKNLAVVLEIRSLRPPGCRSQDHCDGLVLEIVLGMGRAWNGYRPHGNEHTRKY